eukprot:gene3282-3500_t
MNLLKADFIPRYRIMTTTTPTITNYGVKISYFTQFLEAFGGREAFQRLTTTDVCEKFVKPTTADKQCSWIEHLQEKGSEEVNSMLWFVEIERESLGGCLSTKPEDLESIRDAVRRTVGFEAFNRKVRDAIREYFIATLRNSIATAPGQIDEKLGIPLSALQLRQQIGALYFQQEDYDKAEAENLEILNILKPIYGEEDDPLGFIIAGKKSLARIYESQKKHDKAKTLLEQIVQVFQKKHGNIHPNTLLAQVELERFLQGADREMNIDSEKLLLFLNEDDGTDKEEITLELLDMKVLFAQQLQAQEEFKLAEVFYRESYDKGKKHLGSDHINVLTYQRNLGNLYTAKSDYEKGEEILKDCITRMKNTLGSTDQNTLVVVCDLVTNLKLQKKFTEAENILVTSTDDCKALYSVDSVNTLHMIATLGAFYYEQQDYLKAFPYLETAATKGIWIFGPLDDRTVEALTQWDTCKKYVKAEEDKKREEALAHTKPPVKGWFYKQSKWLKAWRNRYIVVDENKLFIAKDESAKPHIIVPLKQSTTVRPISDMRATADSSFYFEVKDYGCDGCEVYYFYTSSENDRQRWIEVIENNQEEN